ncbi:BREX-1 system phosphatase PglZ type A [Holophaga foetida]|uniref:BREX-1 system phosphatase PglZ type A n=1 Tax=Holophaga foetida TaxID=35839 RepID=UPI000247173E|nr:BREX-1 system phosphatase PglZ type A [Holophaga foetida]
MAKPEQELKPILDALQRFYDQEGSRIVFWHDPAREFVNALAGCMLLDIGSHAVTVLDLTPPRSDLALKLRLEQEDPQGKFLLYAPFEEPDADRDWLLDIRLYSQTFRADRASIHLQELGLASQDLHGHLTQRAKFLDAKERVEKLRRLVNPGDGALDLDLKMMALVLKAEQPEPFVLLRTLFHAFLDGEAPDLDTPPSPWKDLVKFDLAPTFWGLMKQLFGYGDAQPSLQNLLLRLLVADFGHALREPLPQALRALDLPKDKVPNVVACLAQWRDSSRHAASYDALALQVESRLKLKDHLSGFEGEALAGVMTFPIVERAIASRLKDRVLTVVNAEHVQAIQAMAVRRQAGHWATPQIGSTPEVPRETFFAIYEALGAAASLFELRMQVQTGGFPTSSPEALYQAYEARLYRFDQLYRQFNEGAVKALELNLLKDLQKPVENVYLNGFLKPLAMAWDGCLESRLQDWRLSDVVGQPQFWDQYVAPRQDGRSRTFVIISDAFRYEAAQELTSELNGKYRVEADLSSCLGVLPSITSLGMASLLPHQVMTLTEEGQPLLDGQPAASLEQRAKILQAHGGMACKAEDLMAMKKDEGRAYVEGAKVVYVYHNLVDTTGETRGSEEDTFKAVRGTITFLARLANHIVNSLNGNHVVITADHGFIFTQSDPGETEKSKLGSEVQGAFPKKSKKRYVMGRKLPKVDFAFQGKVACAKGDAEFLVPRGIQRFHFVGGARFIHGGATLQEVVVPVVVIRHRRGSAAKGTEIRTVQVQVLGASHKITTAKHGFELIQTDAVSERVKPLTVKLAIYEGSDLTTPISDVQTLTFSNTSDSLEQRKQRVLLTLREGAYNRTTPYRLVLREAETSIELQSVPVTIDRAFTDDF